MINSIRRNDTVVTAGGMVGKVTKIVNDDEVMVELTEGVRVRVIRSTIAEVRTRGDIREAEARKSAARNDNEADDPDTKDNGSSQEKSDA
jgi:preprotein translocase subunit YajC